MIYGNNKNKLNGYPSPLATNEEKAAKEYGLEYFKTMYYEWHNNGDVYFRDLKMRYNRNRSYAEGNQDVGKYKDLLDVQGDSSYLNIDWTPVSVVPKFVDVIVNGMVNQEYDIKAKTIDPIAASERLEKKKEMYGNMLTKDFLNDLEDETGIPLTPKGFIAESSEEIEMFMALNYKQNVEIALEKAIEYTLDVNDYDETKRYMIRDLVVLGLCAAKTEISKTEGVKIRHVDPANLITSFSAKPDYKNIRHAGEVYSMTIADLKMQAGDEFSEEDYIKIAKEYAGKNNNPLNYGTQAYYENGNETYDYDKFSVNILDAEFITSHSLNYEKKENKYGGYSVNKKPSNYKKPKKSKTKREDVGSTVKVIYKGKYIVGTDYIFNYGMMQDMPRPKSNLSETRLSYIIYQPNLYKMKSRSLVDRMIPFADQIQLAHLKIQHVLAKARPKGAAFEIGSLENVSKGDGGTFTPMELQEIYDQTGNIYYRRIDDEGQMTGAMPIQELENGIGRDFGTLIGVYNHNMQMIRDVTGVNEARDASKPSSEALVGVQKLSLLASNNATRDINDAYLNVTRRVSQSITIRMQDLVNFKGLHKMYTNVIGDSSMHSIDMMKKLSIHEFGITLDVAPSEEEKQMMEQNIQVSLAQKELRLEDAIMIRSIKNIKMANQMLVLRRAKYQEEQQAMARQASEQNAVLQQQSAQQAAQLKQQEMQAEVQIEQARIQAKAQAEMELKQLEFQLKEQFEQSQHQRRLREIELGNLGKEGAASIQGEVRKAVQEQSAMNQSQMIEQRKDRRGPLGEQQNVAQ
jgi:hypothetical protein|tara:strand:+ start:719 stop:3118 length:2400 start_codon:yes stop_codon:yes gene_type:complete